MIALNEIRKFENENFIDPLVKANVYESMKNVQWVQTRIGECFRNAVKSDVKGDKYRIIGKDSTQW